MAAASRNPPADGPAELRNTLLADALQIRDIAAIAFALRHGPTVVPLLDESEDEHVWTYLNPETGEVTLLLFSDVKHKPASLPPAGLRSPAWLRAYLTAHRDDVAVVFLDIAGPHPMQASPDELLRALEA
jgi:hypothetical protein